MGIIMKGKNREMTMSRYVLHLAVILLALTGLIFLLGCEKEGVTGEKGELVDVVFTIDNGGYEEENTFTRSEKIKGERTKFVPLKGDLYLAMTLKPAEGAETRAWDLVEDEGKKVMLAAYKVGNLGTPAVTPVLYKVSSGVLVPDVAGTVLRVPTDGAEKYRFVAYSFNSTSPPTPLTGIDPSVDLLWGSKEELITAADQLVEIEMKHKFSRVQMRMDVRGIEDATVVLEATVDGGMNGALSVGDGAVTFSGSASQPLDLPVAAANVATSEWRTVTPTDDPDDPENVVVRISQMEIDIENDADYTFTNKVIVFDGPLAKGTQYVLEVKLRRYRWALSNIYWSMSKERMTFDKPTDESFAPPTTDRQQGLFFKWGSLVGIAPTAGSGPLLYLPGSNPEGGWNTTYLNTSTHSYWPSPGTFASIPYMTRTDGSLGAGANSLLEYGFTTYTGDICSFLDGGWRMPNRDEFGDEWDYDLGYSEGSDPDDKEGNGSMWDAGAMYNSDFGQVFLPASGVRNSSGQAYVGIAGSYWSGSQIHQSSSYYPGYMEFSSSFVVIDTTAGYAFSVRCIRKLRSEMPTQ
jgi:uncharacterized protein (TIGR02145 family)